MSTLTAAEFAEFVAGKVTTWAPGIEYVRDDPADQQEAEQEPHSIEARPEPLRFTTVAWAGVDDVVDQTPQHWRVAVEVTEQLGCEPCKGTGLVTAGGKVKAGAKAPDDCRTCGGTGLVDKPGAPTAVVSGVLPGQGTQLVPADGPELTPVMGQDATVILHSDPVVEASKAARAKSFPLPVKDTAAP